MILFAEQKGWEMKQSCGWTVVDGQICQQNKQFIVGKI